MVKYVYYVICSSKKLIIEKKNINEEEIELKMFFSCSRILYSR